MRERARSDAAPRAWMTALGRLYARAVAILASTLVLVVVAVMGAQVFYRYVLNDSLIWAEEVSGYLLVLMTFLFIGAAFERGEMVTIRFFVDMLPPKVRLTLMIPSFVAMITFLLVLSYYAMRFASLGAGYNVPAATFIASAIRGRDTDFQLSMYWLYLAIPAGCLILCGHFLAALWRLGRAARGRADLAGALPGGTVLPDEGDG